MITTELPSRDEMLSAFLGRDAEYDGVFVTAVTTTGIFCRPSCPARKPRPEHVEFLPTPRDALLAGFRPCLRCRPLEDAGAAPEWLRGLLAEIERDPMRRWTDQDLRQRGLGPDRVRRWFQAHHGMTFHGYERARRLGLALGRIRHGGDVTSTALDHGYDSVSGFGEAFGKLFGGPPSRTGGPVVTVNRLASPLGPMVAAAGDDGLCLLEFGDRRMLQTQLATLRRRLGCTMVPGEHPVLAQTQTQLERYFSGQLVDFTVPLVAPGTEFQEAVWTALRAIPSGETVTYSELARRIGRPSAVRAVGSAVGDNRLAIIIPCHRVVGSDGRLTGYGGGLWRKQRLLEHERAGVGRLGDDPPTDPS